MKRLILILILMPGWAWALSFALDFAGNRACFNLGIDTDTYHSLSRALLLGADASIPTYQPPGFLVYLAGIYALFGTAPVWPKLLNVLMLILMSMIVWRLGKRAGHPSLGFLAATAVSYSSAFRAYSCTVQYEVLAALLFLMAFDFLWSSLNSGFNSGLKADLAKRKRCLIGSASILSVAMLTRETFLVVAPVLASVIFFTRCRVNRRAAILDTSLYLLVALLPAFLWSFYQFQKTGETVLISSKGSINFALGNNPNASGTFNLGARPIAEPSGLKFISDYPAQSLELAVRKIGYFWGIKKDGWNVPDPSLLVWQYLFGDLLSFQKVDLLNRIVLSVLFLMGLILGLKERSLRLLTAVICAVTAVIMCVHIVFIASFRFIVPLLPLVFLVASIPFYELRKMSLYNKKAIGFAFLALCGAFITLRGVKIPPVNLYAEAEDLDGLVVEDRRDEAASGGYYRASLPSNERRLLVFLSHVYLPSGEATMAVHLRQTDLDESALGEIKILNGNNHTVCRKKVQASQDLKGGLFVPIELNCTLLSSKPYALAFYVRASGGVEADSVSLEVRN